MRGRHRLRTTSSWVASRVFAFALWVLCATAIPAPADAVIIDSGDGTGNTTAPPDDPGWDNVGTKSGLTVVYLRNGWVITANHVGIGDILLDGGVYAHVPGSGVQLDNGDGTLIVDVVDGRAYNNGGGNANYDNGSDGNFAGVFEGDGLTTTVDPDDPATWTHDDNWRTGWHGELGDSGGPPSSNRGWIIADFGSAQSNLDKLYIWNENTIGNRGWATVRIYYATAVTLPSTGNNAIVDYDFSDVAWTEFTGTPVAVTAGTGHAGLAVSATIDISSISSARYIGIEAVTDNGAQADRSGISEVVFTQVAEPSTADLLVYAITPIPTLPDLEIRANPSLPTGEVILVGKGRDRGAASDTDDPGIWTPPGNPVPAIPGFYWGNTSSLRWGTNEVTGYWTLGAPDTESIYTLFDETGSLDHTPDECQGANGDSGGALFAKDGLDWELAGIIWGIATFGGQNPNVSALRGNATIAADLSFYQVDIDAITATPVPEPAVVLQLVAGAAITGLMAQRRHS